MIGQIQKLSYLQYLTIRESCLCDRDIQDLATQTLGLEWLDLSLNDVSDEGAKALSRALSHGYKHLKGLDVRFWSTTVAGQSELCASVLKHAHIHTLAMDLEELNLASVLLESPNNVLEELDINVQRLSPSASQPLIEALGNNDVLKVLHIHVEQPLETPLRTIYAGLGKNKTLECLHLSGGVSDDDVRFLASALQEPTSVNMLCLRSSRNLSPSVIPELLSKTNLQQLDLSDCKLSDDGWREVARAICRTRTVHTAGFGKLGELCAPVFLETLAQEVQEQTALKCLFCSNEATEHLSRLAQTLRDKLRSGSLATYYNISKSYLGPLVRYKRKCLVKGSSGTYDVSNYHMRLHAGYKWRSIPEDRRKLLFYSTYFQD